MPTIRLNKRSIDNLVPDPSGRPVLYWDEDLQGFGVLVSGKTDGKTYVVQRRISGSGKNRRVRLERVGMITVDEARDRARMKLAEMYAGNDPKRARARPTGTLRDVLNCNSLNLI